MRPLARTILRRLREPVWSSVALGLGVLAIYVLGACPTIYVGDSGELVTAVYTLGIPHPSGYPLYVLLGKPWTLLVPIGSIAYRMSLFSAACAAAAVALVNGTARRLGLHPAAAATAALVLAFGPSFWGEANIQRVYALNALAVALATAAAFEWHRSRRDRTLVLAFLACGIGATNHTVMAVYAMALGLFALATDPGLVRRPRTLAGVGAAFALGLLPYLYLPLRSRFDPPLDWSNPEAPSALLRVVLRRDFWDRRWIESPADLVPISWDYVRSLGPELSWAGAALAVLGIVVGARRRWPVALAFLVMAGNLAAMGLHGSRTDIFIWHRYYIPSYLMGALLAGMGAHAIVERLPPRARWLPLAVPMAALLLRFPEFDRSRYRIAEDFSRTLLSTVPPGAHLTANDDNILFVLIYLRFVERLRPDLDLILEGVADAPPSALRFNPDVDPLFFTHHPNWSVRGLEVAPAGLVFQTVREGRPWPRPTVPKWRLDGEDDPRVPKDDLTQNLIGHFHYMIGTSFERSDWPQAAREYALAQQASPDNDVLFFNLGLIYRRNGLLRESLRAFERSHAINPRRMASRDRVVASERAAEVRAELAQLESVERELAPQVGADVAPGSAAWHGRMAELLRARGLELPARGHALRAQVLDGRPRVDVQPR